MAEHGALATLKDLAEKEVEDAARLLGEMRRGCQQAEEQLMMNDKCAAGTGRFLEVISCTLGAIMLRTRSISPSADAICCRA